MRRRERETKEKLFAKLKCTSGALSWVFMLPILYPRTRTNYRGKIITNFSEFDAFNCETI